MSKKMWGGRFSKPTHPLVEKFTGSIHYDHRLAEYDLMGSMIHVEVLRRAKILDNGEASKMYKALEAIYKKAVKGIYTPDPSSEDIHTDIQNKLEKSLGGLALKLHTARSRNDQIAFTSKLYTKIKAAELGALISDLIKALGELSDSNKGLVVPAFTHMQHAQVVYLKDYFGAYVGMLGRDAVRLDAAAKNIKLIMGAGAVAGTPIDSAKYEIKSPRLTDGALAKSFDIHPVSNSIDAVSDRDFVIEMLSVLSMVGMHISRLSEDLIIWSTKEFGFVELDDAFATGSSLMPQKKNPDVLELARGYTGRLYGNLINSLTVMKGLPLSYNRDMQLDKEPLFDSIDIVTIELKVFSGLIRTLGFNKARIEEALEDESLYATDLVYYLVGKGIAFKTAHSVVGGLVKHSIDSSIEIKSMSQTELDKYSDKLLRADIIRLINPVVSVKSKLSIKR
ncbi:MAG: argininosuccinate lyase [Candidatus Omnitrophota bacterium]